MQPNAPINRVSIPKKSNEINRLAVPLAQKKAQMPRQRTKEEQGGADGGNALLSLSNTLSNFSTKIIGV